MKVQVRLKFMGPLGRLAGHREATVSVEPGTTVAGLLAILAGAYGPAFAAAIFRAPGEAHTHLRVFLNEGEAAMHDRVAPEGGAPTEVAVLVVPGFEGGSR
jgi:hypothetical protein